jgi:hypothetical protein
VTPLENGLSGASVFAVTTDTGSYVVRRQGANGIAKWTKDLLAHSPIPRRDRARWRVSSRCWRSSTRCPRTTFRALRRLANVFSGTLFMSLVTDLTAHVPARAEDAPTLLQFYGMLGSGALALRSDAGQAAFGSALLRQALER